MSGNVVKPPAIVAVTGANGFIGSYVVGELLKRGYTVRAIVRNPSDSAKTAHLEKLAEDAKAKDKLEFCDGDLYKPGSYDSAFKGAEAVIHTAAIVQVDGDGDKVVKASVDGTANVLASVKASGTVRRMVHTSSVAAVMRFHEPDSYVFTEDDEATDSTLAFGDAYGYAKLTAERMVWTGVAGQKFDAVSINPGVVLGPCLIKPHTKASPAVVRQFLYGNEQANYFMTPVDVRDVAFAHVEALTRAEAGGMRFILANAGEAAWMPDHAKRVAKLCPEYKVSTTAFFPMWKVALRRRLLPLALIAIAALGAFFSGVGAEMPAVVYGGLAALFVAAYVYFGPSPYLTKILTTKIRYNVDRSKKILNVKYTDYDKTLRDTVESMANFIKLKTNKKKA